MNNLRKVIKLAGYRWKQARVALTSTDPDYRVKLDAIKSVLSRLADDEAVFSIDEFGPVAIKMRAGRSLRGPTDVRVVPQWQKSKGTFILTAALELAGNQVTYFFSESKNSFETIQLIEELRRRYRRLRRMYLFWDAAPWHSAKKLIERVEFLNEWAQHDRAPTIQILPLPTSAQFLNVIESVFSGLARAVLHGSDYPDLPSAKQAVCRYLEERNAGFQKEPRSAGKAIWGKERQLSVFNESGNFKSSRYR